MSKVSKEELQAIIEGSSSYRECAKKLKVSYQTVKNWVEEFKLQGPKHRTKIDGDFTMRMSSADKEKLNTLAEFYGLDMSGTIRLLIKETYRNLYNPK